MDALTITREEVERDFRLLPDDAPLAMPVQSLHAAYERAHDGRIATSPRGIAFRRFAVIGGALAMTCVAAYQMVRVLDADGINILELFILALFVTLFGWIALAFTSAVAGFLSLAAGHGDTLGVVTAAEHKTATRTAILVPVYNESAARVMAGLQAIDEELRRADAADMFDIFILSDSTNPERWIEEEAAFLLLRDRTGGHDRIFYRRRLVNTARKSGNIADWVTRFGAAYPFMLILDADSVMTADALVRLAAAMERHPGVALIQTLPTIVNGRTLFARMQQFAGRVYGPVIAHGIAWWHGAEGNYWGHNAIIRTRAFAAHAGLPELPGRKPFGGHIMSHDFVEAALLRRAGWAIRMAPSLAGSYEETPPSLPDLASRDRRWCQGNLQHAAVLPARGLHPVSRLHMLMGIGSYVTAPIWLVFLLAGILLSLRARFVTPDYFPNGHTLFPVWPTVDPVRSKWLFIGTMAVLLAPKLLGLIATLLDPATRRGCGGAIRTTVSLLIETVLAALLAPVMMMLQSVAVADALSGRDGGWNPQRREDGSTPFGALVRRYWRGTLFAIVLTVASYEVSPLLALWMSPVLAGLMLAVPLIALTGAAGPGTALRRLGLLRTPEEHAEPAVLTRARSLVADYKRVLEAEPAMRRLFADVRLLGFHHATLAPPRRRGVDPINAALVVGLAKLDDAETFDEALAMLTDEEKAAVLASAEGLERLGALA